jgi:phosphate transport system protein
MRDVYQEQLARLGDVLADMCGQVALAMENATRALLEVDLQLAEQVIADDVQVDHLRADAEEKAFGLLALQAPVATDLRVVVAAIHGAGDIERMGDLALHVAQAARRRHPQPVLPPEVTGYFAQMGTIGTALARKAADVIRTRDVGMATMLEADDDAMDDLHRRLFELVLGPDWPHGVEAAVDAALLGRFYERYADHAVNVGQHVIFLVTGEAAG